MPNILDGIVRNKTLYQKMKQLSRIMDSFERREKKVNDKVWDLMGQDFSPSREESALMAKARKSELDNNYRELGSEMVKINPEGYNDFAGWFGKCYDGNRSKLAKKYRIKNYYNTLPSCDRIWFEGAFLPSMRGIDNKVRLDPLMYVDHPSKIISDYAKMIINGEIE